MKLPERARNNSRHTNSVARRSLRAQRAQAWPEGGVGGGVVVGGESAPTDRPTDHFTRPAPRPLAPSAPLLLRHDESRQGRLLPPVRCIGINSREGVPPRRAWEARFERRKVRAGDLKAEIDFTAALGFKRRHDHVRRDWQIQLPLCLGLLLKLLDGAHADVGADAERPSGRRRAAGSSREQSHPFGWPG